MLLFALFSLLNGSINFEILIGIGYGFLYHYFLKNYLQISDGFICKMEGCVLFHWMMRFEGFVSVNQIGSHIGTFTNNRININEASDVNISNTVDKNFTPFSGNGMAVGSSEKSKESNSEYDRVSQNTSTTFESFNKLDISENKDEKNNQ